MKTENKSTPQILQETITISDSDKDVFPTKEFVTTANIHDEEQITKSKNNKTAKAKKYRLENEVHTINYPCRKIKQVKKMNLLKFQQ